MVRFARTLVADAPPGDRLARVALLFSFVRRLAEAPEQSDRHRAGVLVKLARLEEGPAVLLSALLLALGERARLEDARELTFVRVPLAVRELRRLPPHASVILNRRQPRCDLVLDPRRTGGPLGFLPRSVRRGLARRRAIEASTF